MSPQIGTAENQDGDRTRGTVYLEMYKNVAGFNVGVNCGDVAGQTVGHAHIHLVPGRSGDIADPRGGVRGVIPEKRIY